MNITWDDYAVPTITGDDDLDVVTGVGHAQAIAVGGDVLELYGIARGRAASYWGAAFLKEDTFTAQLGLDAKTDEWFAAQLPETVERIEAFCRGFNAACEQDPSIGAARREALPVVPRDVVAHVLRVFVRFNQIDAKQLAFSPLDFYGIEAAGSNSWAIAGPRSTTGNAMVMINPHLSWSLTYHRFVEFRTVSPTRDFHGCTLLGVPWQAMGYGPTISWAHTVNPIRNLTVFGLVDVADGSYAFDGGRRDLDTVEHVLEVKDAEAVTVTERRSVHGPVVTAPDGADVAIRISGVLSNPAYHALESWWQMSTARTVGELVATHDRLHLPMYNITAGDSSGSIAAVYCGTPPVRQSWQESQERQPGDDASRVADEVHPATSMPRVIDPDCGWINNCNETPFLWTSPPLDEAAYPAAIAPGVRELTDMRPLVSRDWLARHETISPDQLLGLKFSKRAVLADLVLDELVEAASAVPDLAPALDVLRAWDRETHADSKGYLVFWLWAILSAPSMLERALLVESEEVGGLPTGLKDVGTSVAVLQMAVGLLTALGVPLDLPIGQLMTLGEGEEAVPADGGSGTVGVLKCYEIVPTPTGSIMVGVADTWVSRVQMQADAPPVAESLMVYGNTTEPGAPASPSQYRLWAADELRPA